MFLADRYIRGECPKCGAKDQYGDACENCSTLNAPTDLIRPYSTVSGATPVMKASEHFFFRLSDPKCVAFLQQWTQQDASGRARLQPEVFNKAQEWLGPDGTGLADWDISRDAPYLGIPIPDAPGKYFYVWLDAPVGYLASLKEYVDTGKARASGELRSFEQILADPETIQIHFIGKDIVYFHTLFWPAMLKFAGTPYKVPDNVYVHGFLTALGEKMSKSRGTGISPDFYLDLGLNSEWLRYYIATKLNDKVEDIDFNPDDFVARVNSDLIGKYVNIASRAAKFITEQFDGVVSLTTAEVETLRGDFSSNSHDIADRYSSRQYSQVVRDAMSAADRINEAFDQAKPWALAKDPERRTELQSICSRALFGFKYLTVILAPILPELASQVARQLFGLDRDFMWADAMEPPKTNRTVYTPHDAYRPQADRRADRGTESGSHALTSTRSCSRRDRETCGSADFDRRFLQGRTAHRENRQRRARRGSGQVAEADPRHRRSTASHRVRGHQVRVQTRRPDRASHADGRQSCTTQDEIRPVRRHGARRVGRRSRHFPAHARLGRCSGDAYQMTQMSKSRTRSVAAIGSGGASPQRGAPQSGDRARRVDAAADTQLVGQTC